MGQISNRRSPQFRIRAGQAEATLSYALLRRSPGYFRASAETSIRLSVPSFIRPASSSGTVSQRLSHGLATSRPGDVRAGTRSPHAGGNHILR